MTRAPTRGLSAATAAAIPSTSGREITDWRSAQMVDDDDDISTLGM